MLQNEESGQTIISGMGELHLEILVDRMKREFKVEAEVGAPQVAYRETIKNPIKQEYKYAKQSGGKGQYGHVYLDINPLPSDSEDNFKFHNAIKVVLYQKSTFLLFKKVVKKLWLVVSLAGYQWLTLK